MHGHSQHRSHRARKARSGWAHGAAASGQQAHARQAAPLLQHPGQAAAAPTPAAAAAATTPAATETAVPGAGTRTGSAIDAAVKGQRQWTGSGWRSIEFFGPTWQLQFGAKR